MDDILDTSPDITAQDVEYYVSSAEYPITLDNLIKTAYMQHAPQNIIDILSSLEPGVYHSLQELDQYLVRALKQTI